MSSKIKDLLRSFSKIVVCAMLIATVCMAVSCNRGTGEGTETETTTEQPTETTVESQSPVTTQKQDKPETEESDTSADETEGNTQTNVADTDTVESETNAPEESDAQPDVTDAPQIPADTESGDGSDPVDTGTHPVEDGENTEKAPDQTITGNEEPETCETETSPVTDSPVQDETQSSDNGGEETTENDGQTTSVVEEDVPELSEAVTEPSTESDEDENGDGETTNPTVEPDGNVTEQTTDAIPEQTTDEIPEQTTEADEPIEDVPEETTDEIEIPEPEMPGLEYSLNDDGESYSVKGIGEISTDFVVIPSTYKGKPVVAIMDEAFKDCNIIVLKFGVNITKIGARAFDGVNNLSIYFGGTKKQWIAIERDKDWAQGIGKYMIYPMHTTNDNWEIPIG